MNATDLRQERAIALAPGKRVTSYRSVRAHLLAPVRWTSTNSVFGGVRAHPEFPAVITLDGEAHEHARAVVAGVLDREVVSRLVTTDVAGSVVKAVEGAIAAGAADAVADVARPIVERVSAALLGLEPQAWLTGATSAVIGAMGVQDEGWASGRRLAYDSSLQQLHAFFVECLRRERRSAGHGAVALLAAAARRGDLTAGEAVANLVLLAIAGTETSVGLLAGVVGRFAGAPELRSRLRAEPSARMRFIEEVARLESPSGAFFRLGAGSANEVRLLCLGAANRDQLAFEHAEQLDLDRVARRHLAFGWGTHHCLGAGLARAMARALLDELVRRDVELVPLDDETRVHDYLLIRQPVAARYEWRAPNPRVGGGAPIAAGSD